MAGTALYRSTSKRRVTWPLTFPLFRSRGCHRESGVIREAIDYLERGFEFISKTLRNPQNAARALVSADFCTVNNFLFEVL